MMFLRIVRINYKLALTVLCVGVCFIIFLWNQCGHLTRVSLRPGLPLELRSGSPEEIECLINGEYPISCRKEGDEVYLPFSFLNKYFEVYGKLASYDGVDRFEWSHSYGKVYHPKTKYDPRGVFVTFENYNVEDRDRVKCVSAAEGVPVSTQWAPDGFYYPTQIAQFGLAHYSKNLTRPEPRRRRVDDGELELAEWAASEGSTLTRERCEGASSNVMRFFGNGGSSGGGGGESGAGGGGGGGIALKMDHVLDFVLSFDVNLKANASVSVLLKNRERNDVHYLHYVPGDVMLSSQDEHIYYGIGKADTWKHLTRDLIIDLQKGIYQEKHNKKKLSRSKYKIIAIVLNGHGMIDNITLASSEHMANFYAAADWFVANQDPETGGWPIPVRRKLAANFAELKPGWYSAMSQGHAISLLARAAHRSGKASYLHSAIQALRPFRVPSWHGGVLTSFLGKYPWYEEYPTSPSSFVLNGFIYSLLGLYDLHALASAPSQRSEAKALYDQGMESLKKMLPLFDTGTGSVYDLRHFTLGITPNVARWDYHATHVNQLFLLAGLERESIFAATARRWEDYMQGKRAPHN